jgi:hypothetical protein
VRHVAALGAAALALAAAAAAALSVPTASGAARSRSARAAAPEASCSNYPKPGMVAAAGTPTPPAIAAEYGVMARPRRAADHVQRSALGTSLAATGLILSGARYLGPAPLGGRVYAIPALHVLAYPLAPARCVPKAQRPIERSLLPVLHREYRHRALCVVIVYAHRAVPTCGAAPGTLDPLLFGIGVPGFGLVPDGIPSVTVHFAARPSRRAKVHGNFWILRGPSQSPLACGVDWLDGHGVVLRTSASCTRDVD